MHVSVAMAAYNGENYIVEQIDSILSQLKEGDELIISLNPSTDRTEEILKTYVERDCRVKLFICKEKGVIKNFENAIMKCSNDIIFLSDQDDIWVNNKIEKQKKYFNDYNIGAVCHGCIFIDEFGALWGETQNVLVREREIKWWEIIVKNPVQGATLAFRKELRENFLPFPKNIPMHDSWIGLCICKTSKLLYINEQLLLYRQHNGTVTVRHHKKVREMIKDRIELLISLKNRYL